MRAQAGLDVNESTGWGVEAGYRFSDYWSARLEYADMDFNAFDKAAEIVIILTASVTVLMRFTTLTAVLSTACSVLKKWT